MSECVLKLQQQGEPYPRTCPTCGLSGKCPYETTEPENLMSHSLVEEPTIPQHAEALAWIDRLVLDMKLSLIGEPNLQSAPITIERLSEWHKKVRRDVERCKEDTRFKR